METEVRRQSERDVSCFFLLVNKESERAAQQQDKSRIRLFGLAQSCCAKSLVEGPQKKIWSNRNSGCGKKEGGRGSRCRIKDWEMRKNKEKKSRIIVSVGSFDVEDEPSCVLRKRGLGLDHAHVGVFCSLVGNKYYISCFYATHLYRWYSNYVRYYSANKVNVHTRHTSTHSFILYTH